MSKDSDNIYENIIKYLEGQMNFTELKSFEKNLSSNPQHLNLLLEIKKDITLMNFIEHKEVPKHLLTKVLSQQTSEKSLYHLGRMVLQFVENKLDIVSNSLLEGSLIKELIPVRDSSHTHEQIVCTTKDFTISITHIDENKYNMNIHLQNIIPTESISLYRMDKKLRLLASITPEGSNIQFNDLQPDHYQIIYLGKQVDITLNPEEKC